MLFKSPTSTIGIDLRDDSIKIVEMDTGVKIPRILNFRSARLSAEDRDERAIQIKSFIEENGFHGRQTNIAFPSSSVLHKTIMLPRMSRREMKAVIKREAKKEASSMTGEIVHDSLLLGSVVEKGIEKNYILLVIASKDEVNDTISFWRDTGLEPQLLTTVSLALLGSLKITPGQWEKEITAFLYLGQQKAFIIISDCGNLEFSRDFILEKSPREPSDMDLPNHEYVDRAIVEMNRSLLYYKHQFRGKTVQKIILSGEVDDGGSIKEALSEGLDQAIEVDDFLPAENLDLTHLGTNQKAFVEQLPSLAISLGLCMKDVKKTKINLMPAEVVERQKIFIQKSIFYASAAMILVALLLGYVYLFMSVKNNQRILIRQQVYWREIAPMVTTLTQVERDRKVYQSRLFILENFRGSDVMWQNVLKSLSLMVPDEMLFHLFQARKRGGDYRIDIKGEVVSESAASAQVIFNQFYDDLKHASFFKTINPPSIRLNPYVETLGRIPGDSNVNLNWIKNREGRLDGKNLNKLTFEISGICGSF